MDYIVNKGKQEQGFTLVEVIIAVLILSIIASAALLTFTYSIQMSRENQYSMTAANIANERMEYIRSLAFAKVGTKSVVGANTIYGDPKGDILQEETMVVDGVTYILKTTINWEDESGWDLGDVDWDYKSVRLVVIPQITGKEAKLTKELNSLVTRDFTQPVLTGANIALRIVHAWKNNPSDRVPVGNAKVSLISGPSAPRQVQTSSGGIARFLEMMPGKYSVKLDLTSAGMLLNPDVSDSWMPTITDGFTATKEFEAEYPGYLNIILKDLGGNPISLMDGITGVIQINVPYGTNINRSFTAADVNNQGVLNRDIVGGLWPVGAGYSGAYTITKIGLNKSTFFGAFENSGGSEIPWSGTFDAPNTVKNLICYFGVTPQTPSRISDHWVDTDGNIVTFTEPYYGNSAVFETSDSTKTIIMGTYQVSEFNAQGMYFENTGSGSSPGLLIQDNSQLMLNAGVIVFRGVTQVASSSATKQGKIRLSTVFSNDTTAVQLSGAAIGGKADPGKMYGKIYFEESFQVNKAEVVSPGGYYFYDNLVLPDHASDLIPITKDNYIG